MKKITIGEPPYAISYNEEEIKSALEYARVLRSMIATVPRRERELISAFSSEEYVKIECEPADADLESPIWEDLAVWVE